MKCKDVNSELEKVHGKAFLPFFFLFSFVIFLSLIGICLQACLKSNLYELATKCIEVFSCCESDCLSFSDSYISTMVPC